MRPGLASLIFGNFYDFLCDFLSVIQSVICPRTGSAVNLLRQLDVIGIRRVASDCLATSLLGLLVNSLAEKEKKKDFGLRVLICSLTSIIHWLNFHDFSALRLVHVFFILSPLDGNLCAAPASAILRLSCNSRVTPRSFRDFRSFDSDLTPLPFLLTSSYSCCI